MKRVIASIAGTVAGLVLLLGFKTHSPRPAVSHLTSPNSLTSKTTPPTSPTPAGTATTVPSSQPTTIDGDPVDTKYGPVEVQVTLSGKTITNITAIEYPTSRSRDRSINNVAIPKLTTEALAAQSAQIDAISGASYTSDGFASSLQSALDKTPQ